MHNIILWVKKKLFSIQRFNSMYSSLLYTFILPLSDTGDSREHREFDFSPNKHVVTNSSKHPKSSGTTVSPNETNVNINGNRRSTDSGFGTPVVSTRTVTVTKPADNVGQPSVVTSAGSGADYITPKRKRKFPGPAGLLPDWVCTEQQMTMHTQSSR